MLTFNQLFQDSDLLLDKNFPIYRFWIGELNIKPAKSFMLAVDLMAADIGKSTI